MEAPPIDLKALIPSVQVALREYLSEKKGEKLEDLELQQAIQRPFSAVGFLRARTSKGSRKLVIKKAVHHPVNKAITERENQAVVEYNILKLLHPEFENVPGCSVPQPILVFPEIETYLMEFVEGQLLMDEFKFTRFLSAKSRFHNLREHMNQCGRWLKHFQEFTGKNTDDTTALEGVIERAKHRLKLIQESGDSRLPVNFESKVIKFLSEQIEKLHGKEIPVSGRHGDFTPLNVIAGSKGITVIDFLGYQVEPIPVDILKVLVFLQDEMNAITSNKNRVKDLKDAFLEGYGCLPCVPKPALLIIEAMQRIVSLYGNLSKKNKRIHHRIETNRCVKEHLRWLMADQDRKPILSQ